MHVGVEEAVAQRVAQEGLDHRAAERRQVEALGLERGAVVERRAVDPFQRQHLARGAVPVDRRHAEVRIVLAVFSAISESAAASSRKSISIATERRERRRPTSIRRSRRASGEQAFGVARGEVEGVEIGAEAPLDAGPQHLHRDRLARAVRRRSSARCTCAIEAAATGGPER